jgi:hypothetical protein
MRRRLRNGALALTASLVGSLGVLASCNFIVGVGDYAVGEGATDATSGGPEVGNGGDVVADLTADRGNDQGPAGDARGDGMDGGRDAPGDATGDRPPDAAADIGPDVDAQGDAQGDAAGGADSAEAGNTDADAGVTCGANLAAEADASTDFQKLVNTCVLAASCDPFVFPVSISDCISNNTFAATGSLACLTTIADCNGFYGCQGVRSTTPVECPSTSTPGYCDPVNNIAFDCYNAAAINCVPSGGTCRTFTDDRGNSRADCAVVDPCTVGSGGLQCSGNNLYGCFSTDGGPTGVGYGRYCSTSSTCATTASGGTDCYFNGSAACGDAGTAACQGASTLAVCSPVRQSFPYDCTRAGGTCAEDDAGNAGCVLPGCSLNTGCAEACDFNGILTVCVGGAPLTIDCTKYGYTVCGGGGNGPVYCGPF